MQASSPGPETATPGRRDRKKLATRQALRSAALELVAERGFDHVTVEDISEAVDVSPRTFFNYFQSKEEAIVGSDPERVEELRRALAARPPDESPLDMLRAEIGELTGPLMERHAEWALRARVVRETPALLPRQLASFAAYERVLAEAVAQRTGSDPDGEIYPALTAAAAMAAFRVAVAVWRAGDQASSLSDLFADAIDNLAAGLAPPQQVARPGHDPQPPPGAAR